MTVDEFQALPHDRQLVFMIALALQSGWTIARVGPDEFEVQPTDVGSDFYQSPYKDKWDAGMAALMSQSEGKDPRVEFFLRQHPEALTTPYWGQLLGQALQNAEWRRWMRL